MVDPSKEKRELASVQDPCKALTHSPPTSFENQSFHREVGNSLSFWNLKRVLPGWHSFIINAATFLLLSFSLTPFFPFFYGAPFFQCRILLWSPGWLKLTVAQTVSNLWPSCLSLSSNEIMGALLGFPFLCLISGDNCCFILSTLCWAPAQGWPVTWQLDTLTVFLPLNYLVFQQKLSAGHKAIFWNGNLPVIPKEEGEGCLFGLRLYWVVLCVHTLVGACCLVSRWLLPHPMSLWHSFVVLWLEPRPSYTRPMLCLIATSSALL